MRNLKRRRKPDFTPILTIVVLGLVGQSCFCSIEPHFDYEISLQHNDKILYPVDYFFNVKHSEDGFFWSEDESKARMYNITTVLDTLKLEEPIHAKKMVNLNNERIGLITSDQRLIVFKNSVNGKLSMEYQLRLPSIEKMACFDILDSHDKGQVYIPCLAKQKHVEEKVIKLKPQSKNTKETLSNKKNQRVNNSQSKDSDKAHQKKNTSKSQKLPKIRKPSKSKEKENILKNSKGSQLKKKIEQKRHSKSKSKPRNSTHPNLGKRRKGKVEHTSEAHSKKKNKKIRHPQSSVRLSRSSHRKSKNHSGDEGTSGRKHIRILKENSGEKDEPASSSSISNKPSKETNEKNTSSSLQNDEKHESGSNQKIEKQYYTELVILSFSHDQAIKFAEHSTKDSTADIMVHNSIILRDNDQILSLRSTPYNLVDEVTDFVQFSMYTDLENPDDKIPKSYIIAYKHDAMLLRSKKSIQIRYFSFDLADPGKIIESGLFKQNLSKWKVKNYRGVTKINNNSFIVLAESYYKSAKKTRDGLELKGIEFSLDFKHLRIKKLGSSILKNIPYKNSIIDLDKGKVVSWNEKKELLKGCNLIRRRHNDACETFSDFEIEETEDIMSARLHSGFLNVIVRNHNNYTTRLVTMQENQSSRYNDNEPQFRHFKPQGAELGIFSENMLILAFGNRIESHPVVKPHLELSVHRKKARGKVDIPDTLPIKDHVYVLASDNDLVDEPLRHKIEFTILPIEEPLSTPIPEIPEVSSIEVYGKHHFMRKISFAHIEGNIKSYELRRLTKKDRKQANKEGAEEGKVEKENGVNIKGETSFVDIELRMDEEIKFSKSITFPKDPKNVKMLRNNIIAKISPRTLQVWSFCSFNERSRLYKCKKTAKKHLGRKIIPKRWSLGSTAEYDGTVVIEILEPKQTEQTQEHQKKKGSLLPRGGLILIADEIVNKEEQELQFRMVTSHISRETPPKLSKVVILAPGDFAYVSCYEHHCFIHRVEFSNMGTFVELIGLINSEYILRKKFCPFRIDGTEQSDQSFYIVNACSEDKKVFEEILKFKLIGKIMYLDGRMVPHKHMKEFELCGTDQFLFYNKHTSEIDFRHFYSIPRFERNILRLSEIGFRRVDFINCKHSNIIVTGTQKKEGEGVLTLAAISMRRVLGSDETFLDNKFSSIRFLTQIIPYTSINVFVDDHPQYNSESLILIHLTNEKNEQKLYGIRSELGPILYLKPTLFKEESRVAEFELRIGGFKNHHLRRFKVFKQGLDKSFSVSPIHQETESKPVLRLNKMYALSELIDTKGFMEINLMSKARSEKASGVHLNKSIEAYSTQTQSHIAKGQKALLKNRLLMIAQYEDWRLGVLRKRGIFHFKVWRDLDNFQFQFRDDDVKNAPVNFSQFQIFHSKKTNTFYLLYVIEEEASNYFLRTFQVGQTKVNFKEYATYDTHLLNMKLHIYYDEESKTDKVYIFGKESVVTHFKHSLVCYEFLMTERGNYINRVARLDQHYDALDYVQYQDDLYIVYVKDKNALVVLQFDFRRRIFSNHHFDPRLELNINIVHLKCKDFYVKESYSDLLGHCIGMTEGRTQFHFQIPKNLKFEHNEKNMESLISSRHIYIFDEFIDDISKPQWDLSDNFIAFYAEQSDDHSSGKLVFWKLSKTDGLPFKFVTQGGHFNKRFHPFAIGTSRIKNEQDFLMTSQTRYSDDWLFVLNTVDEQYLKVTDSHQMKHFKTQLIFKGIKKKKLVRISSLFKPEVKRRTIYRNKHRKDPKAKKRQEDRQYDVMDVPHRGGHKKDTLPQEVLEKIDNQRKSPNSNIGILNNPLTTFVLGIIACSLVFLVFKAISNGGGMRRRQSILGGNMPSKGYAGIGSDSTARHHKDEEDGFLGVEMTGKSQNDWLTMMGSL